MIITRYKPLFSFAASYDQDGVGVTSDGVSINAPANSLKSMDDFKLKPKFTNNTVIVFFEGKETPPDAPVNSVPNIAINTDEYFYFSITLSDKEKIKALKFHPNDTVAKEIGFPVMYHASIPANATPPGVTLLDDVKIVPSIFTFIVTKAQSALNSAFAMLVIKDENNNAVNLNVQAAPLTVDPATSIPQYVFNVDASLLKAGIYSFKTGNYTKKFFITSGMDISNAVSLVRVLKNSFLGYNTNLADNSFAAFELVIPKA